MLFIHGVTSSPCLVWQLFSSLYYPLVTLVRSPPISGESSSSSLEPYYCLQNTGSDEGCWIVSLICIISSLRLFSCNIRSNFVCFGWCFGSWAGSFNCVTWTEAGRLDFVLLCLSDSWEDMPFNLSDNTSCEIVWSTGMAGGHSECGHSVSQSGRYGGTCFGLELGHIWSQIHLLVKWTGVSV